jgi:hypothetical protein
VVALHTVAYVNESGSLVADEPCAHVVDVGRADPDRRRHALAAAIGSSSRLGAAVRSQVEARSRELERELTPLRDAVSARIAAIRSQIGSRHVGELQRSLFDRRAENETAHAGEVAGSLDAALRRRQCSVDARVSAGSTTPRLAAVWAAARR